MTEPARQPDLFDRLWERFTAALQAPIDERPEQWRALALVLAGVGGFAILLGTAPALFLNDMALDLFIPLDGAWRMHHGQWPHADFYTPIGALYYVLLGLAGTGPEAVIHANLILMPLTTAAAVILTRQRLPSPLRLGFVAMIALMTISPRTLDSLALIGHLASYNRHGWTLTTLVMAGVLLEPRASDRRWEALETATLVICVLCAFYLKITFFVLSGAVLIAGVALGGRNRAKSLAAGATALGLVGLGFLVTETNALYLADLRRAAAAGSDGERLIRVDRFTGILTDNGGAWSALVVGIFGYLRTVRSAAEERLGNLLAARILVVGALCTVIASQSHDHAVPPLVVLLLVSAMAFRDRWEARGEGLLPMQLAAAAAMAFLLQPVLLDGFSILRHTSAAWSSDSAPLADIAGSPVRRIRVPAPESDETPLDRVLDGTLAPDAYDNLNPPWNHDDDVILRDAWELLHRNGLQDRKVASLTFSPSFPWMLGTEPPRHLPAWYDFRRTFTASAAGDLGEVLSDTEVILVPKVWRVEGIWDVYGPYVREHYELRDETGLWRVWVLR